MTDILKDYDSAPPDHWPEAAGLPRQVLIARLRLGPNATPDAVAAELRAGGLAAATAEDVKAVRDEGHLPD